MNFLGWLRSEALGGNTREIPAFAPHIARTRISPLPLKDNPQKPLEPSLNFVQ
jgi:hypothetical protein